MPWLPTLWDHHNNLRQRIQQNAREIDQPVAALLADLKQRDLLKDTLVVWGGEFGRTTTGQSNDGRNHNNRGFSMWMAGGGVKGGMRYGHTDRFLCPGAKRPLAEFSLPVVRPEA